MNIVRVVLGTTLGVMASVCSVSAQSGLVAAYGLNEGAGATAADASGNGHTGTLSNTSWSAPQ
jgi:hypothetical protein